MTLQTHPNGVAHLASATLPAAGAFTNQTAFPLSPKHLRITVNVTYTYAAANGQVLLKPMWTIGGTEIQGTVEDTALDLSVAPFGRQSVYLHQVKGPIPQSGSALSFPFTFDCPAGATAFRCLAAEIGVTGTPGTCAITLSGLVDQS